MSILEEDGRAPAKSLSPIYPPRLADVVCSLMPEHPLLLALGPDLLREALTAVFFASLQTEEGVQHPIRVALVGRLLAKNGVDGPLRGDLSFRLPCPCTTRHLLRLSHAASSERLFITIARAGQGLCITGLTREGFGQDESDFIKVRALKPGCLEVWVAGERVLEYVRGYIQKPPEDVLLSLGLVRDKLLAFAAQVGAPAGYIESVASAVRHLADQPHGGILILSAEREPKLPEQASFALESDSHLWDALNELGREMQSRSTSGESASHALRREIMRSEIQRSISEIGNMTSLDGATILDRRLGVRGFGIVLPVRSDISVVEVINAAATERRPFPLDQYGARHRAAASYAATYPGSLVFIASVTGDIGCMLDDEGGEHVLLWRFRSHDLASPAP